MAEPKRITVKEIIKDELDETYPRVLANVVNDKGKEIKLTVFKKKAKEKDDGSIAPEIIPQAGHSYMGYFKKPDPPYTIWSFNIAWGVSSQEPEEPTIEQEEPSTPPPEELEKKVKAIKDEHLKKISKHSTLSPEQLKDMEIEQLYKDIKNINLRLKVAEIEATRENRLTKDIPLDEFVKNCKRIEKYVETGE